MSRPLRIEYPDAWYHAMNRGRRNEKVFLDRIDCQTFIHVLVESIEMWNLRVSAYCLMPNHYHLLVQTPDANIARCMRHINGVYTQRFNSRHRSEGQLFKGRYKSILVNGDEYLLQLVRYIHRNPVKAGFVKQPADYLWSSHRAYLSFAKKWDWLNKTAVYLLLSDRRKEWISLYRKFMTSDDDEKITGIIEGGKWPSVLGPKVFIDWVKSSFYALKDKEEIPEAKSLAPSTELIVHHVCRFYVIDPEALRKSRRGVFNEPRNVAIYLVRRFRHDTLKEIGQHFRISKYSSVSSVLERMNRLIGSDVKIKDRIERLIHDIIKSQEQT